MVSNSLFFSIFYFSLFLLPQFSNHWPNEVADCLLQAKINSKPTSSVHNFKIYALISKMWKSLITVNWKFIRHSVKCNKRPIGRFNFMGVVKIATLLPDLTANDLLKLKLCKINAVIWFFFKINCCSFRNLLDVWLYY